MNWAAAEGEAIPIGVRYSKLWFDCEGKISLYLPCKIEDTVDLYLPVVYL